YESPCPHPAPGSAQPHGPTAIGPFPISNDADGNQVNTLGTGTSDQSEYVYDEENRLSCANKGPQVPTPACNAQGNTSFIYDHDGVRKVKTQSSPVIYPNQYYTDFGGGAGNQFKNIFIGSEHILTKKARIAPDRQHWYYHTDHLHSTGTVTNENGQMVDAVHYFPFGEVWLEEVPASLPVDYFFTAKELDQETGFYDFGQRYLDPRFSKWMTADPALRIEASSPIVALNPYQYGHHNPLRFFDPNGETDLQSLSIGGMSDRRCGGICFAHVEGFRAPSLEVAAERAQPFSYAIGPMIYVAGAGGYYLARPGAVAVGALTGYGVGAGIDLTIQGGRYAFGYQDEIDLSQTHESGKSGAWWGAFYSIIPGPGSLRSGMAGGEGALTAVGGGCSFAENTPVTTSDGLRPIGELKIGDRVLARNEATSSYAFEPITQIFRHQDPVKVHLTLEDPATGATEVIETTPEHPFHMPGRGFVPAGALNPDDTISRAVAGASSIVRLMSSRSDTSEVLRVKNLTFENQPFLAYNLEVDEDHTFFVGAGRALVHNAGPRGNCAYVANGVLYLWNKFAKGSVEDLELQKHVVAWNQEILAQGGSLTRQSVSKADRLLANAAANAEKQLNPSLYPKGTSPGHTPDVGWGGKIKGPFMPLNSRVNEYVGGTTQGVKTGTTYTRVELYR